MITNLIAVPLLGADPDPRPPGLCGRQRPPLLAYPLNACNGFLVTILIQSARGASRFPFASVTTPGVPLLLVGLFCAGCLPPIVAEGIFSSEHRSLWAAPPDLDGAVVDTRRRRPDL